VPDIECRAAAARAFTATLKHHYPALVPLLEVSIFGRVSSATLSGLIQASVGKIHAE
jgi:hypothetical protein